MRGKRWMLTMLAVAAVGWSCATPQSIRQNEEIANRIRNDIARFYENMAQAYFMLGFDCYTLSQEAVAGKNTAVATQYVEKARLYRNYSEELKASARLMRQSSGTPVLTDRLPSAPPARPVPSLDDYATTALAPTAPPAGIAPKATPLEPAPPPVREVAPKESEPRRMKARKTPSAEAPPKVVAPAEVPSKVAPPEGPPPKLTPSKQVRIVPAPGVPAEAKPSLLSRLKFWGRKAEPKPE